jgi:hypothetical protein
MRLISWTLRSGSEQYVVLFVLVIHTASTVMLPILSFIPPGGAKVDFKDLDINWQKKTLCTALKQ